MSSFFLSCGLGTADVFDSDRSKDFALRLDMRNGTMVNGRCKILVEQVAVVATDTQISAWTV
jgi:hypothetical protein